MSDPEMARGGKIRTGLVLEGGAMRGLFSAGVLDALMEEGIDFDGMVGVSAGAAFGCNFKSRQTGRALRYNTRFCRNWRYCSWRSWLFTGDLFGAEFCYHELPERLDPFDKEEFRRNPLEFYLVCTDVETGRAVYHRSECASAEEFEWMRASGSMPLVSRMVELHGRRYLDGALSDSIPLEFFERAGFARNLVVLTQPAGFVKKPSGAVKLLKLVYRKYPELVAAAENRHVVYNAQLEYVRARETAGAALVIRPERPLPIGRISHSPEELRLVHALGRRAARERMAEIRSFIAAGYR